MFLNEYFLWHIFTKEEVEGKQAMRSNFHALVLILLGVIFLLSNFGMIPRVGPLFHQWWPVILIFAGVYLLVKRGGK
jgi:hypothetical protein